MTKKTATYLLVAIGVLTAVGIGAVVVATRPRIAQTPAPEQLPEVPIGGMLTPETPVNVQLQPYNPPASGEAPLIQPGVVEAILVQANKPQLAAVSMGFRRLMYGRGPRSRRTI